MLLLEIGRFGKRRIVDCDVAIRFVDQWALKDPVDGRCTDNPAANCRIEKISQEHELQPTLLILFPACSDWFSMIQEVL
jgi:hypothetical protein